MLLILFIIQGLGPVIIKVNELLVTTSIFKNVFNLTHYAEYESTEFPNQTVQVFKIGDGGLGGEIHLYQSNEQIELKEEGIVEQLNSVQIQLKTLNMHKKNWMK